MEFELAEARVGRARRPNVGKLMDELLKNGLDEEDEKFLREYSDDTSDSSFLCSDEEAVDIVDSDFSDEEVQGVLANERVETEASIRREERESRKAMKNKQLQRAGMLTRKKKTPRGKKRIKKGAKTTKNGHTSRNNNKNNNSGSDDGNEGGEDDEDEEEEEDLRRVVRKRPAPTIPLEKRLQMTLQRAEEVREQQLAGTADASTGGSGPMLVNSGGAVGNFNMGRVASRRPRRGAPSRRGDIWLDAGGALSATGGTVVPRSGLGIPIGGFLPSAGEWRRRLYEGPEAGQRVCYSSGRRVQEEFGVDTIVSFSHQLPAVFRCKQSM